MTKENKLENPLTQEVQQTTEEPKEDSEQPELHLRNFLIQYTGFKLNPEDEKITLQMLIHVLADEFPEIVMAIAEENFMRGYQQGIQDVETMSKIPEVPIEKTDIETDIIDAEFEEIKKEDE